MERSVAQSVRYVLPAFPFMFIAMGRVGVLFEPLRETLAEAPKRNRGTRTGLILRAFIAACLAANAVSVLSICPHFLAYFNEVAGGPSNGPRHLLFSNLDWGQDLFSLKDWIAENPEARPLGLAYFHFVDPALEGIEFELPPRAAAPGWYALSANFVHGMGFGVWDGRGRRCGVPEGTYSYFQQLTPTAMAGYSIYIYHLS